MEILGGGGKGGKGGLHDWLHQNQLQEIMIEPYPNKEGTDKYWFSESMLSSFTSSLQIDNPYEKKTLDIIGGDIQKGNHPNCLCEPMEHNIKADRGEVILSRPVKKCTKQV